MGGRVPVGKLGCCGEVNARKCGLHGLCATTKQDFDNIRTVQNGISLKRCDTCPDRIELPDGEIPVPTGKLRVGMLSPNWYVGGVERWFQTLARYSELEIVGVAVDSGNRVSPAMLGNGFRVTHDRHELVSNSDVLLIWHHVPEIQQYNKPTVFVIHGCLPFSYKWSELHSDLPQVAVSHNALSVNPNATVIPNGVDESRLQPTCSREEYRYKLGLKPDDTALLYVGRFSSEKDPLRCWQTAKGMGAKAIYCCSGLNDDWKQQVPGAIITDDSQLGDLYRACDAMVFGSENESFGLVIAEAWYCGLPVVAHQTGVVLEQGCSHLVTTPVDGDWISAVQKALTGNTTKEAQQVCMERFTGSVMASKWDSFLLEVSSLA